MGRNDRPEDEEEPQAEQPEAEEPQAEAEGLSIFEGEPKPELEPTTEAEPTSELEPTTEAQPTAEAEGESPVEPDAEAEAESAVEPDAESKPEPEPASERGPRRHRAAGALLAVVGVVAVMFLLVGWNRVASSDRFCSSCHAMAAAADSASRSVHSDVPCLACHTGTGLLGSLRYVPTLAREVITTFTPWDMANGVLDARPCEDCHSDIAATPELAAAHQPGANCATCHGNVWHPPFRLAGFERPAAQPSGQPTENPHPRLYVQTHGDDVVNDPGSCYECHQTNYCQTCHFRETYPHPPAWMSTHGQVQKEQGADSCVSCHPSTFCAGCHGTEIPHLPTWLGEHWRSLQDSSTAPCMVCHPSTDCTDCHSRHSVHREQDLYT